ncbi:MAG: CDP-glycerol glycerophosphotransferase family protein [Bifidobacteriaceae bacterium]|jgi:hypothetical protein|nr:CDP-glycerol glycerophosphotransferase family protein [Bifidobacteriaceae bacterium]
MSKPAPKRTAKPAVKAAQAAIPQFTGLVTRKMVKAGIWTVRHSRLLPKSIPDGRGDERQLAKTQSDAQVMVFFADTVVGLYQIRPWYQALRELDRVHPVVVIGTDSRAVKAIRAESGLRAYTITHYSTVDGLIQRWPLRLALYCNHNAPNFSILSFPQLVHVSIMHGDSDKIVSISGQTKAYDFTFVPGQAAIDRLAAYLPLFDAASRCIAIGRPQVAGPAATQDPQDGRRTVLYAPTWEGGTATAAYSSLEAYGPRLVRALLDDPRFRLLYRPHPLTGTRLSRFGDLNQHLRGLVEDAAAALPQAGHRVSLGGPAMADLWQADLLVSDVGSLAIDYLVTGRPLAITVPTDPAAVVAPTKLLAVAPRLELDQLDSVGDYLGGLFDNQTVAAALAGVAEYYLGDLTPGAATSNFIAACGRMIELCEANRAEVASRLAAASAPASAEAQVPGADRTEVEP